jgi:hypothetical protein
MIGILSEPSPQIGGQIGGGLSSDSSTVRLRTLEESFETTAVATVKVASANVRVIKMGFIENPYSGSSGFLILYQIGLQMGETHGR